MAKPPKNSDELYGFSRKLERLLEKARLIFREFADYLNRQKLGSARRLKHVEIVRRFESFFVLFHPLRNDLSAPLWYIMRNC